MLIGQAGSALAAELGIQRNSEQIAALEVMGVSSRGYLVAPRLIASFLVVSIADGALRGGRSLGGSLSGSLLLGVESGVYWSSIEQAVGSEDVRECFIKAAIFGLLSISICAYHGFNAHLCRSATGARAVSASHHHAPSYSPASWSSSRITSSPHLSFEHGWRGTELTPRGARPAQGLRRAGGPQRGRSRMSPGQRVFGPRIERRGKIGLPQMPGQRRDTRRGRNRVRRQDASSAGRTRSRGLPETQQFSLFKATRSSIR